MINQRVARIMVGIFMLFLFADVAKSISPFTCSLLGHYHFTKYADISSSASSSVRWSSGRSFISTDGGKSDCKMSSVWQAIYHIPVGFIATFLSLPAALFEFIIPVRIMGILIRITISLLVFSYAVKSIYIYIKSGELD